MSAKQILRRGKNLPWRWRFILALAGIGWGLSFWQSGRMPMPEGLDIKPLPAVVELTPMDMNKRLDAMQRKGITPLVRCRRLAMKELGIIAQIEPPITLKDNSWLDKMTRTVTEKAKVEAFYVVGRDTLYVLSRQSPAIAHELVHAWEDRQSDRMRSAQAATTDQQIALRAAIEGTAVLATKQPRPSLNLGPNLDDNAWGLAYSLGPRYVERFGRTGPRSWLELRPESTYDLMYDKIGTQAIEPPQDSAATGCSDRLGPLAVLTAALAWQTEMPLALRLARQWRGDRLDVWADGVSRQVKWQVVFDDSLSTSDWNQIVQNTQTLPKDRVIVYGWTTAKTPTAVSMDSTLAKRSPLTR